MSTLSELRNSVRDQASGYWGTDDTRLRDDFIDHEIRTVRATLIDQQGRTGLGVDEAYYQRLTCLTIAKERLVCEGYDSGVQHDYVTIPPVASFRGAIAYLGTLDGKQAFEYRSLSSWIQAVPDRFCRPNPAYTIIGDRAYLKYVPKGLEFIMMTAVLQDPARNACIVDFEDTDYPLPQHRVHELEVICLKQLLATLPISGDDKNNAADDSGGQANVRNMNA